MRREKQTRKTLLFLPIFWFLICISLFSVKSIVQAATGFQGVPSVFDDENIDNIFSPNGDGKQDTAVISFTVNSDSGFDYRIVIDTLKGDGFNISSDWVKEGSQSTSGTTTVTEEWSGKTRNTPVSATVSDGAYQIRVEIDLDRDGTINNESDTYDLYSRTVVVDTTYPRVSASTDKDSFSPNGDGVKDKVEISYFSSENVSELYLKIDDSSQIELSGSQGSYQWNGTLYGQQSGFVLEDGNHNLEIIGIDKGGNEGKFSLNVNIDTVVPSVEETFLKELKEEEFLNYPITQVTATLDDEGGTPIDFEPSLTKIVLKDFDNKLIAGNTRFVEDANQVILKLNKPLGTSEQNGEYSMTVHVSDEAGNSAQYEYSFILDTLPPNITKVTSGEFELIPFTKVILPKSGTITIQAADATSGVDLSNIQVNIQDDSGNPVMINRRITLDNDKFNLNLDYQGLQKEGTYIINILSLSDRAGNSIENDTRYKFRYVISTENLPSVVSINPNDSEIINSQLNSINAILQDNSGTGINLTATSITITGPGGNISTVKPVESNGTIEFPLSYPLKSDGTDDGIYSVTITPEDNLGQVGQPKKVSFSYDTLKPELVSLTVGNTDISLVASKSYVNSPIDNISAVFQDNNGSGIDSDTSSISVKSADSSLNGTLVKINENSLDFSLNNPISAGNGSQDGNYSVTLEFSDKAGNSDTETFQIIYDTQVPTIKSITPAHNTTVNNTNFQNIEVVLEDNISGIDFQATDISLRSKEGEVIDANLVNDGNSTFTLNFDAFATDGSDDGEYIVEIIPADLAQNRGATLTRRFFYISTVPEIELPNLVGKDFVSDISEFSAQLLDYVGVGIDFGQSTIVVTKKDSDEIIAGTLDNDKNSTMTWTIDSPIAHDGTADGVYTIDVSFVNRNNQKFEDSLEFTLDTQIPTIKKTTPAHKSQLTFSLNEISVQLEDKTSKIVLSDTEVRLIAPDGEIATQRTDNGVNLIKLSFEPLKTDGTQDGVYRIEVSPSDLAGNKPSNPLVREFSYLSKEPEIVLNINQNEISSELVDNYTNQMNIIEAEFVGYTGLSIDQNTSTLTVQKGENEIAGETALSENNIQWKIETPLARDASDDGEYDVNVNFVDSYGQTHAKSFKVKFDTQVPTIQSSVPAEGTRVDKLSQIKVEIADNLSGVDFAQTDVRLIGPSGQIDSTKTNDNQSITLLFNPLKPEQDSGEYTIEVVPVDLASNTGGVYRVDFVFARNPEIAEITPNDKSIVNRLSSIEAILTDYTGEGIDFDNSQISLTNPKDEVVYNPDENINLVSARMSHDNESILRLELNLPTDGTADGEYTIDLHIADKLDTGTDYTRTFIYDSQPPKATLVSPSSTVNEAIPKIEVSAEDIPASDSSQSGVDLANSTVKLISPVGEVEGEQTLSNNNTILFAPEEELPQTGKYTIEATIADRAGNTKTYRYNFDYVIIPPQVVSMISPEERYVNSLEKIIVALKDNSGTGLDFSSTGSDIEVIAPDGSKLGGVKENDGDNLIFNLTTILDQKDSTDDGIYTVNITPVDNTGIAGTTQKFSLVYDTQKPEVVSVSHVELFANTSYTNGEISEIEVNLQDKGNSDIDFENSKVIMTRQGIEETDEDSQLVGKLTNNQVDTIWLTLDTPLSSDGKSDGKYTVELEILDKAGNELKKSYPVIFDTKPPTASLNVPDENQVITGEINEIVVQIEDSPGASGVDLNASSVELTGPDGSIPMNKNDNGVDTLIYTFMQLSKNGDDDGTYLINVTSQDKAGNISNQQFEFFYIAKAPKMISAVPGKDAFVNRLDTVNVTFSQTGQPIDLKNFDLVVLSPPDEKELPGTVEAEDNTISYKLAQILPTDGSVDGEYIIQVKANAESIYQQSFVYDTQIPTAVSVIPAISEDMMIKDKIVHISESFSEFTINLSDANTKTNQKVSGLDFDGTVVNFVAPDGSQIYGNKEDNGLDEITYSFPDLIKVGTYSIQITPKDRAGNISEHPFEFKFNLDFERPVVADVLIADEKPTPSKIFYSNNLSSISATIEDKSGTGIDLKGSKIELFGPDGEVEGIQTGDIQSNTITWEPGFMAIDGSTDGTYNVTILPADNTGRTGTQRRYTIVYDTQEPEVSSVSPVDVTSAITHVSQQIRQVEANIVDVGPAGIEIEEQQITLKDSSGKTIPGVLTDDGNQRVIWTLDTPLATDGSDDGKYSVSVNMRDQAGNEKDIEYALIYDTQPPQVVSTVPADKETVKTDIKQVKVQLEDPNDGQIDFDASKVELFDPNGNKVSEVEQKNNGIDTIILQLDGLEMDGTHIIRINAVDKAGNRADTPVERKFVHSTGIPIVVSTTPQTLPADVAFVNELEEVEAELKEVSGSGIDFTATGSEIRLIDSQNNIVPGTQVSDENNKKITWELATALATDGSEDGNYRITVVPVNSAGRRGEMKTFTFVYDTVAPEVEDVFLQLIEGSNSLSEIGARIRDDNPSSGIDWDNVDNDWIRLEDSKGKEYSGVVLTDKTEMIRLKLSEPLASDGSQDDTYTVIVNPRDKAGNVLDSYEYTFDYDTEAPMIDPSSLTINNKPLLYDTSDPDYPTPTNMKHGVTITAKITDNGLGTDLAQSNIVVELATGGQISGKVTHNGIDTLKLTTGLLPQDGIYRVTIYGYGLDSQELGIRPYSTLSTTFLLETTKPVVNISDYGGKTTLEDEELELRGTAYDPENVESGIPASGVALVEVGGIGPDGEQIEWIQADDDSKEEEDPWSEWSINFMPSKSGEYEIQVRVTDVAGNSEVYDAVTVNFTVSLGFRGDTYVWPNPLSRSRGDTGHFAFNLNIPGGNKVKVKLYIYDVAGDLVYTKEFSGIGMESDNDQLVTWNLKNSKDYYVASGIYVFRLEAINESDQTANQVGRILVIR